MKKQNVFLQAVAVVGLSVLLSYVGINLSKDNIERIVQTATDLLSSEEMAGDVLVGQETSSETNIQLPDGSQYPVQSVIDGDTFTVSIAGKEETVRVLGINTPETKYSSRGAECYGQEARIYAKELLQEGNVVTLTLDPTQDTRDKYNRILAYVTLPDGRDFGQVMIADGFAYEYTFKGRAYQKQALYKQAQQEAKQKKVGLWGVCSEV